MMEVHAQSQSLPPYLTSLAASPHRKGLTLKEYERLYKRRTAGGKVNHVPAGREQEACDGCLEGCYDGKAGTADQVSMIEDRAAYAGGAAESQQEQQQQQQQQQKGEVEVEQQQVVRPSTR
jgi:hypothetical protein